MGWEMVSGENLYICRNRTTASKMFTYLLDKRDHSSLLLSFKTLNIWIDVLWQETHPDLGHVSHPEWWKPLRFRGETIRVWKFPLGFHLWHPVFLSPADADSTANSLHSNTVNGTDSHSTISKVFSPHSSKLCSLRTSLLIFLISCHCPWQPLIDCINYKTSSYCVEPLNVVPHQHRKCGVFYRHPFLLHKQSPNDTHQADAKTHVRQGYTSATTFFTTLHSLSIIYRPCVMCSITQ